MITNRSARSRCNVEYVFEVLLIPVFLCVFITSLDKYVRLHFFTSHNRGAAPNTFCVRAERQSLSAHQAAEPRQKEFFLLLLISSTSRTPEPFPTSGGRAAAERVLPVIAHFLYKQNTGAFPHIGWRSRGRKSLSFSCSFLLQAERQSRT
jgi:hypothetical protein